VRTVLLLAIALLSFIAVAANTITVTTNADSGPGSLREAITLANANGTAITDTILFNVPGTTEAARTITLQTELPQLSSNIIIDGTSQPGAALGLSDAKITLYLDHFTASPFFFLYLHNAQNIKIYGICLRYFANPDAGSGHHYGIYMRGCSNITIGAPGKGNMFSAVRFSITNNHWNYFTDSIKNITIQSNVFGLSTSALLYRRGLVHLERAAEVTIGGTSPADGNLFVASSVEISQAASNNDAFFVRFQNNRFNVDWAGSFYYYFEGGRITFNGNNTDNTNTTKTFVLDNIFTGSWPNDNWLQHIAHRALVQGNKFGVEVNGSVCRTVNNVGFINCKNVVVGGHLPSEENIISGTIYTLPRGVHIIKNKLGGILVNDIRSTTDPFAKIVGYDNGVITGKSNPNAKIQLYSSRCFTGCLDRLYFSTVHADAAGDWSFAYTPAMPNLIATATTPDSSTSEFTEPKVNNQAVVVTHPTCGKSNGSISGLVVKEGTHIRWVDAQTMQTISTDTNLVNVPAGNYMFMVSNGANGCPFTLSYSLVDQNVPANIFPAITHASCGQNSGSIHTTNFSSLSYKWLNSNNDSIGNNSYINNLPPGTYYVKATLIADTSCSKMFGPFVVQNLSGPSLNIGSMTVTAASCGNSNGSITGITASNITGSPFIRWVDSLNNPVGSNYDLLNVPAGKYKLKVKDGSSCDTMSTQFFIVPGNGNITIDTTGKKVTAAKCTGSTGSIQQIKVTGGDTYQWINTADNSVVGTAVNVFNLPPGSYKLVVSNAYGCTKTGPAVTVPQANFIPIGVTGTATRAPFCGQNNGSTRITSFNNDSTKYTFRWIDSARNLLIGTGTSIYNLDTGTYQLFATDTNGCEKKIFTSRLGRSPAPVINYSNLVVKDDQCNALLGGISGLQITGIYGPTTYSWVNQNNVSVGSSLNLQNAAAGTYRLQVVDAGICSFESNPIIVKNSDVLTQDPLYSELVIPRNSPATLSVKNPSAGNYKLFADAAGTQLIQQNSTGNFTVKDISTDTSFYVQKTTGTCSSALVRVNVKVVDKSFFAVPNAFTPNGDRLNERLPVKVMGHVEITYFRIFNRWGQLIFETRQVNTGWDGTFKGQLQPSGVYVWVAEGKDVTGKIVRDKGSFVLIR
jgi:gliding motility-associated-like protein